MRTTTWKMGLATICGLTMVSAAHAAPVTVTVESLEPSGGLYFTPMWVGFHDGTFDTFTAGNMLTPGGGMEQLAEDGATGPLSTEFSNSPAGMGGGIDDTITAPAGFPGAPVFDPGDSASMNYNLDPTDNRYFSFASMIIPSNDAFIGNDNPMMFSLFDGGGNFTGPLVITITGQMVWDAGTEANTELEAAFINQTGPGNGTVTADPVALHPGFIDSVGNPGGTPIILGGMTPAGTTIDPIAGDFTQSGHQIARITITPEPTAGLMMLPALLALRRRRKV